jgi:hypothetical protein
MLGAVVGTAPAGMVVSIFDGNMLLGTVVAGADQGWQLDMSPTLSPGRHALSSVTNFQDRPLLVLTVNLWVSETGKVTVPVVSTPVPVQPMDLPGSGGK